MEEKSFNIASTKKRLGAFVLDDMVMIVFLLVIFYDQLALIVSHLPEVLTPEALDIFEQELRHFSAENLLLILSIKVLYHTVLVWQNGMTFGKYVMKIHVVELETGRQPTFSKALLRGILRIGSELVFYLGYLLAYFTPLKQTFHDKFSSCVVVDA